MVEMVFQRRSRFEIMDEILSLCNVSTMKTQILQKCNLSHGLLTKYLNLLVSNNLLGSFSSDGKDLYHTTPKGKQFIETNRRIADIIS